MKSKALTTPDGYKTLARKVARELAEIDFFVKRQAAQGAWNIGRYIHEHLLARQKRAEHNSNFYERLARDTRRDATTLRRFVQFYLTYPNCAARRNLNWDHYRSLITIKDREERKKLALCRESIEGL